MAIYSIYRFTNLVNGKVYIGQSINVQRRYEGHIKSVAEGSNLLIHRAIKKYGIDNFKFEVIDTTATSDVELKSLERQYIVEHDCCFLDGVDKGYNMTRGGDGWDSEATRYFMQKLVSEGKHHFQGVSGSLLSKKTHARRLANGTHNFQGQQGSKQSSEVQYARLAKGTHHFQGEAGSRLATRRNAKRVTEGTHNFQGESGANAGKEGIKQQLLAGIHSSQKSHTCPHCGNVGKGNLMFRNHFNGCKAK